MSNSSMNERAATLQSAFCDARTRSILKTIPEAASPDERRRALAAESGINDGDLLDQLVSLGVLADSLAAVALIPIIEVAWSDEELDDKERTAVLQAAKEHRLGQTAYELLKHWLGQKPNAELMAAWQGYVSAISESATAEVKQKLKSDVMGRARQGAEAAGGMLGLKKISPSEQSVLDSMEEAFI